MNKKKYQVLKNTSYYYVDVNCKGKERKEKQRKSFFFQYRIVSI